MFIEGVVDCRFTPGEGLRRVERAPAHVPQPSGPSAMEIAKIRVSPPALQSTGHTDCLCCVVQAAIASARSLEEVHQLEAMLKAGQIPGQVIPNSNHHGDQEMEN